MAGLLRPPAARDAGVGAAQRASTCRCTCTPTTPPAGSWPPTWRPGRPAPTPSTVPRRRWPAPPASPRCQLDRRRRRAHRVRHRAVAVRRCAISSRTGRRCERCTRRSNPGCRPDRAGLPPRDPRRAAVQPAPAGDRAGARRPVRGDRGQLRGGRPDPGPAGQGHPVVARWSATWRWPWSAPGVNADEFAADPARFDIPDSVIGFLRGELGDPPGGWPEPLRTKALRRTRDRRSPAGTDRRTTTALALAGPDSARPR